MDFVLNPRRHRANAGGNNRSPRGHIFQERVGHSFGRGAKDSYVQAAQEIWHVRNWPQKLKSVLKAARAHLTFQLSAQRAVTGNLELQIGVLTAKMHSSFNEM